MKLINGKYELYLSSTRQGYYILKSTFGSVHYVHNLGEFLETTIARVEKVTEDYQLQHVADVNILFNEFISAPRRPSDD